MLSDKPHSLSLDAYKECRLCPHACGVNREQVQLGRCKASSKLVIARAALHYWEEPAISSDCGSGTIFFSHCSLSCVYCQNYRISSLGFGKSLSQDTAVERLATIMLELQEQGAANINLVTAAHFAPHCYMALKKAKEQGLMIPVVYNSSAYEEPWCIHELASYIDVWLPDFKYASSELALKFSSCPSYPQTALKAIGCMLKELKNKGGVLYDEEGRIQRGIIVRHLVLPSYEQESYKALDLLWEHFGNDIEISIMNQFTPHESLADKCPDLLVPLDQETYHNLIDYAYSLGFVDVNWQEEGTVSESFIPAFDITGVERSAHEGR